ncbi:MAG: hypothetical protein ACE5FI_12485, partial [Anaerolineales bacterium]
MNTRQLLERITPWTVLALLMLYTYAYLVQAPYPGFRYESDGRVTLIFASGTSALQVGDRLLRVGPTDWTAYVSDSRLQLFAGVQPGQTVDLVVERAGRSTPVEWTFQGRSPAAIVERLNSQWWFPYIFWLAGTMALLTLRSEAPGRVALTAFFYITAIWLSAGTGPMQHHKMGGAIVARAAMWWSVPIYLYLHWIFPAPLTRVPKWLLGLGVVAAGCMSLLELGGRLAPNAFMIAFVVAAGGSVGLLLIRVVLQPERRGDLLILTGALVLAIIPPALINTAIALGRFDNAFATSGSLSALAMLPGAYFFIAYKRELQLVMRRVRRLAVIYLAALTLNLIILLLMTVFVRPEPAGLPLLGIGVTLTFVFGSVATLGFSPFLVLPALREARVQLTPLAGDPGVRTNRLLALYLFTALVAGGAVLALLFGIALNSDADPFPIMVGLIFAVIGSVLVGRAPFERFVNERILGLPAEPVHLIDSFAHRIATARDTARLAQLLKDEVMGALLVRQSALLLFDADGGVAPLYLSGVTADELPPAAAVRALKSMDDLGDSASGVRLPAPVWWRVVLPLRAARDDIRGLWLLGEREPDDIYARSELRTLRTLANQIAIAVINIERTEYLAMLKQARIEQHEVERARLARELHDRVLGEIAAFNLNLEGRQGDQVLLAVSDRLSSYIRQLVADLRPPVLDEGLWSACEEYASTLAERVASHTVVHFEIPYTTCRYATSVEEHAFRVV